MADFEYSAYDCSAMDAGDCFEFFFVLRVGTEFIGETVGISAVLVGVPFGGIADEYSNSVTAADSFVFIPSS